MLLLLHPLRAQRQLHLCPHRHPLAIGVDLVDALLFALNQAQTIRIQPLVRAIFQLQRMVHPVTNPLRQILPLFIAAATQEYCRRTIRRSIPEVLPHPPRYGVLRVVNLLKLLPHPLQCLLVAQHIATPFRPLHRHSYPGKVVIVRVVAPATAVQPIVCTRQLPQQPPVPRSLRPVHRIHHAANQVSLPPEIPAASKTLPKEKWPRTHAGGSKR